MITSAELEKRLGPTWCFDHDCPVPCSTCDYTKTARKHTSTCFDCKQTTIDSDKKEGIAAMQNLGYIMHPCSCYNGCLIVCDNDRTKRQFGYTS